MKITIIKLASLAMILAGVSGCATVVSGLQDEVTFNTSPDGARVIINGVAVGITPTTISMDRKAGQTLRFEKDGYKPYETTMQMRGNGWFLGNIIIGGLLGSTTDIATGAMYEYSPGQYMIALEPLEASNLNGVSSRPHAERVREFIVSGYSSILSDLSNGEGEHLDSLLTMLDVADEDSDAAIRRLRGLAEAHPVVPVFADEVIEHFIENAAK